MFERLVKGLVVTFILPTPSVILAIAAWATGAWGAVPMVAAGALVTLLLGQWMLWLDRMCPGVDRVKAADGLLVLTLLLPLIGAGGTLGFAISSTAPWLVLQLVCVAIGLAAMRWKLGPVFGGPPCPGELRGALEKLGLRGAHRGPFRSPGASGLLPSSAGTASDVPIDITWTNDANGASRMSIFASTKLDVGILLSRKGMLGGWRGHSTGDPSFDEKVRVDGDPIVARARLDAEARRRGALSVADGAALEKDGWRYVGPVPPRILQVIRRLEDAAERFRACPPIDDALLANATKDPVPAVRLACLGALLRRGQESPPEALRDEDPRVRVLAAAASALSSRSAEAGEVLRNEPASVAAGLLADWESGPIAAMLVRWIAERGGPSTLRSLERLAARTPDDALKSAALAAVERVKERAEGEAGHLSVAAKEGGSVSLPNDGAVSLTQQQTVAPRKRRD